MAREISVNLTENWGRIIGVTTGGQELLVEDMNIALVRIHMGRLVNIIKRDTYLEYVDIYIVSKGVIHTARSLNEDYIQFNCTPSEEEYSEWLLALVMR